jgi:hypothetical protein
MSCCGQKRAQLQTRTENDRIFEQEGDTPIYFQYIGQRQFSVIGPKTNKLYRFDKPGAVLEVDRTDGRSLLAVPYIRLIPKKDA